MAIIWRQCTLEDLVTFQRGFDITKAEQSPGPYPVISSSGSKSTHRKAKVKGPGVIIGRKGSLGTVFFADGDFWPHDTTLWVRDFHGNDPRFCFYFLQGMRFEQYDVGASNPTLNRNHIHGLPVCIPPLPIQRRIAAILSAYDDLIEVNTRRIAILEEMARRVYEEWFVRHPDAQWPSVSFDEIALVLSGGTPKKSQPAFWGGEIPFFTPKDAPSNAYVLETANAITKVGLSKCASKLYPRDTTFITARGTVGRVHLTSQPMAMNQSCYALAGQDGVPPLFLYHATLASVRDLKARAHGAVFDTVTKETFSLLRVSKPPNELMARYEAEVRPVMNLALNLQLINRNLRTQRDLLLPRLVSGKLDVSMAGAPVEEDAA